VTAPRKEPKNPQKLVQSAIFALNKKKWPKAKRKLEAALMDYEIRQNAGVWGNYGIVLTKLKLLLEAQEAFTRAVTLDKKNPELWLKKGLTEFRIEKFDEARKSFEKASSLDKKDPEIPILLSRTLRKQGDVKKAIKILESAKGKFPKSHQIPIELAIVYTNQKEEEKAERVLNQAIKTTVHPDPGLLLGQTLLDKKEYKRAVHVYETLVTRFPQSAHAQYGLGVAHHANGNLDTALGAYHQALPLFRPEKPPQSLLVNIARVLKNQKRQKEAIDALYQAKKYGKPTLEISLLLAELFLEINRPDRAKRTLEDAVRIDKYNPIIPFYLGMTLVSLGRNYIPEAKESFRRALELNPEFIESKFQLALLAIQDNKFTEAYKLLDEVVDVDPNHIPATELAAKLAYDLRHFKRTIELLEPIIRKDPMKIKELEILLNSWLLLSQPEEAHKFMEALLNDHRGLKAKLKPITFFHQFLK
jgi:tetratricopeptide (TPR) repeat protein